MAAPALICIGEVLVDMTQTGTDAHGFPVYTAFAGGAPANVAIAAARLGADTAMIGKIGQDALGALLRRTLCQNHVDTSALLQDAGAPTTMALVSVDAAGEREFTFFRTNSADTLLHPQESPTQMLRQAKLLHFGSVSLTADPSRSATFAAAEYAKNAGLLLSFDPNYRAALWSWDEAQPQIRRALGIADVVKVSEEELFLLTGTSDPAAGSSHLAEYGCRLVIVTLGAHGAFCRRGTETCQVPAYPVRVVDTNGAGDAFFGAVLAQAITADLFTVPLPRLCRMLAFASAAAAVTVSRAGAAPALPTAEEVASFLAAQT